MSVAHSPAPSGPAALHRAFPIGAEVVPGVGVHVRVWAPARTRVCVVADGDDNVVELSAEPGGYFSGVVATLCEGSLYRLQLDDDPQPYPDPASRFQPQGPHGPSEVIYASNFEWTDAAWRGPTADRVVYEMHIGTFTEHGTWIAAIEHLEDLAELGITVVEIMPVADFPGRFGWGYDGVDLFAPTRLYGRPDDFRRFVDRAHALGLAVILDVVYNHLGPDGNYLAKFTDDYFTDRYHCEWGMPINFDGQNCQGVREYFCVNAMYWLREFHLDGLRIDATQQIFDASPRHIIGEVVDRCRDAEQHRTLFMVAENEPQRVELMEPIDRGGCGIDSMWNDDFHHSAMVAMTSRADAYYSDYRGTPQEFISALKYGFLYQGQWYSWQRQPRGTPDLAIEPHKFVNFLQNHDQVANSASGKRAHQLTSSSRYRAVTALLLLAPQVPMLFQGQEFCASTPFSYFADHRDEIGRQVAAGRAEFLSQFRRLATPEMQARLPDPGNPMTFVGSKLDHTERRRHAEEYALHHDLLSIRRSDPAFRVDQRAGLDGAVLRDMSFVIRFFGPVPLEDRLLIVNLGRDSFLKPAPEPLLAPPARAAWTVRWASEDPRYGGTGVPSWPHRGDWELQGECATLLAPSLLGESDAEPDDDRA